MHPLILLIIVYAGYILMYRIYGRFKGGNKWLITAIPALFPGTVTLWAAILNQVAYIRENNILLMIVNLIVVVLAIWIIITGFLKIYRTLKNTTTIHIS